MSIDLEQILRVDAGMTALSSYQLDLMRASGKLDGFDGASPNIDCDLFHRPEQLSSELGIRYSISFPSFSAFCNCATCTSCTFTSINNTFCALHFLTQPDLLFCPDG